MAYQKTAELGPGSRGPREASRRKGARISEEDRVLLTPVSMIGGNMTKLRTDHLSLQRDSAAASPLRLQNTNSSSKAKTEMIFKEGA